MQHTLSDEATAIIEKVQKLLALAANNDNEHQAAAASAKAMELLAAWNLDMAIVGQTAKGKQGAARSDEKRKGGLYGWQRDLWKATAELNFCMYWSIKGLGRGTTYEHRILGRKENVVSTEVMAGYLQQTVERLAQQWAKDQGYNSVFVREAIAYREGMATRLTERLWSLRSERLREDERKRKEAEATRQHPAHASNGSGTEIILADVISSEYDLNLDHYYGREAGYHAAQRKANEARRIAAEAAAAEELRKQREWELANPEEAERQRQAQLKLEAKESAAWERRQSRRTGYGRYRADTPREARARLGSYYEGHHRGGDISLNQQIDKNSSKRIT